jgi:lipopolysaccharide biosynthesis regulator YciM
MNGFATLAIHYFRVEKAEQGVAILESKLAEQKKWTLGYSLLVDYYLRNDKLNEAATTLKNAVDNVDDNIRFSLQLASIEESRGNYAQARDLYEDILAKK